MALGAAAAITAAGREVGKDIYLLGVDALAECVEMVENGEMTGTVLNDHVGQSHAAVDAAIAALNGEALQNYYWVDYVKVTK
jgi:methyl-galactoside transport system substrate-binding protein